MFHLRPVKYDLPRSVDIIYDGFRDPT